MFVRMTFLAKGVLQGFAVVMTVNHDRYVVGDVAADRKVEHDTIYPTVIGTEEIEWDIIDHNGHSILSILTFRNHHCGTGNVCDLSTNRCEL